MCYTCLVVSNKKVGLDGFKVILRTVKEAQNNMDGFSLSYGENGKCIRTLDLFEFVDFLAANMKGIINARYVHVHYRMSTGGLINVKNCHLWRVNGYRISHNGYVGKYAGLKKCDTLKFVEKLNNKLSYETLKERINKDNVQGILLLSKDGEFIIASAGKSLKIYEFNDFIVYSSDAIFKGNYREKEDFIMMFDYDKVLKEDKIINVNLYTAPFFSNYYYLDEIIEEYGTELFSMTDRELRYKFDLLDSEVKLLRNRLNKGLWYEEGYKKYKALV